MHINICPFRGTLQSLGIPQPNGPVKVQLLQKEERCSVGLCDVDFPNLSTLSKRYQIGV